MALAETAEVGVRITLDDSQMGRAVQRIDRRLGAVTGAINRNLGRAIDTGLSRLVRGAFGALQAGIEEIKNDNVVFAQTEAVIKSTGSAAGVTADQVRDLATELEGVTGIPDDVIESASNMLLTFTKISGKNGVLQEATKLSVDMAAALGGDASKAAIQLGKALNDPVQGINALRRVGVSFTDEQRKKIESLVKEGKLYEAQKIILKELQTEFGGVAEAQADADPSRRFQRSITNLQAAFAKGLLPAIEKIQRRLTDVFNDPGTQASIARIGDAIGGLLTDENINLVFSGVETAAKAVGTALNAFNQLPAEVKAIAIGAFAINKVTGGGVTAAASAFGKILGAGLDKIFAANVTVIGKNVTGGPGMPGGSPVTGGGGAGIRELAGAGGAALIGVGVAQGLKDAGSFLGNAIFGSGSEGAKALDAWGDQARQAFGPLETIRMVLAGELPGKFDTMIAQLKEITGNTEPKPQNARPDPSLEPGALVDFRAGERNSAGGNVRVKDTITPAIRKMQDTLAAVHRREGAAIRRGDTAAAARLARKGDELKQRIRDAQRANATELSVLQDKEGQSIAAENRIHAAIQRKKLSVTTNTVVKVNTSVAFTEVQRQARYSSRVARTTQHAVR